MGWIKVQKFKACLTKLSQRRQVQVKIEPETLNIEFRSTVGWGLDLELNWGLNSFTGLPIRKKPLILHSCFWNRVRQRPDDPKACVLGNNNTGFKLGLLAT